MHAVESTEHHADTYKNDTCGISYAGFLILDSEFLRIHITKFLSHFATLHSSISDKLETIINRLEFMT